MTTYALFIGCNIPARVPQYKEASKAVLAELGISLVEFAEFGCCGYPARNISKESFLLSSAMNLAIAEKAGIPILALCKCCFGSLTKASYTLNKSNDLKNEINDKLSSEGLTFNGTSEINHLLQVLYNKIGTRIIGEKIRKKYKNVIIAAHYGCHALRPSTITNFDDPLSPHILDELIEVTGAKSAEWDLKTECCGAPLTGFNDNLAISLMNRKTASAIKSGADFIATACPYCHLQFDTFQNTFDEGKDNDTLPPILFPQLLGLAMGLEPKILGIDKNNTDINKIRSFLNEE